MMSPNFLTMQKLSYPQPVSQFLVDNLQWNVQHPQSMDWHYYQGMKHFDDKVRLLDYLAVAKFPRYRHHPLYQ